MNVYYRARRGIRPWVKSLQAVARWRRASFDQAPPIFGNAKPKSGSHLLLQILGGFTQVMPLRYVDAEPIRTIDINGSRRSESQILSGLQRIPPGVIGWGYVEPTPKLAGWLCRPGRVNYFIYRDPRDMLVSQVHFATDMHENHGMHEYYRSLPDFGARLSIAISGVEQDGLKMVSVRQRYEAVLEWRQQPDVLCIRFEDVLTRRDSTLAAMLDQVERTGYAIPTPRARSLQILQQAIRPQRSHTFRSGRIGEWRQHFSPQHKALFLNVAGDLLVRLGYEKDDRW